MCPSIANDHDPSSDSSRFRRLKLARQSPVQPFHGNNHPEELTYVISLLEKEFGKSAVKEMLPIQPGDVEATYADVADLERDIGFRPATPIEDGIARFAKWYREYYGIKR